MTKDVWTCFWDITKKTNGNWSKWAEVDDGCWPTMFDEFDAYMSK